MEKIRRFLPVAITILLVLWLTPRTMRFNGSLIFGEPDEFVHKEVVNNILAAGIPTYRGSGFFFEMPGYFAAAGALSRLLGLATLVSLRYLSFLSILLSGILVFYYLKVKEGKAAGILSMPILFSIPLSVFYLRIGVIEPFLVLALTGVAVFYDLGREKNSLVYQTLSGVFLGLGLLTKYTVLPLPAVMGLFFLVDSIRLNQGISREAFVRFPVKSFWPLFLGLLIFLPVFLYYYRLSPTEVKWQTLQVLGQYGGVKQEFRPERLLEFPWWFSWPVVILSVVGLAVALRNWRRYGFWLALFGLFLTTILMRLPYYPRYGLVLVPFMVVFSALAFNKMFLVLGKKAVVFAILLALVNLPGLIEAWRASSQSLFDQAVVVVKNLAGDKKDFWVISNFWPNYFGEALGVSRYSWLTYGQSDFLAFAPNYDGTDIFELLKRESGYVFAEGRYADYYLTQPQWRVEARRHLEENYKPVWTVSSSESNFPFMKEGGNEIKIYSFVNL